MDVQRVKAEIIADKIQQEIAAGKYRDKIPSEVEISKIYSIAPVTAGKALDVLRSKNIITRIPHVGSFVNRKSPVRIYWGSSGSNTETVNKLEDILRKKFPQYTIEFDTNCPIGAEQAFSDGYDIVKCCAMLGHPYRKYLEPIPADLLKKYLENGHFFKCAFDIHRDNCSYYYALPVFFSPLVIIYNKDLLDRFIHFNSPYDFSIDDLMKTKKLAAKNKGIHFFPKNEYLETMLRYLIFSENGTDGILNSSDIGPLGKRIEYFRKLFEDILKSDERHKFADGNVLFSWTSRNRLIEFKNTGFKWDILPMPRIKDKRVPGTGEFLTVSNRSENKEASFEIAEAFLSAGMQKIIAENHCGLPVIKSLIPDTQDTRFYRDDVFISEIPSMLTNNASEQEMHLMIIGLFYELLENKCDFKGFSECLSNTLRMRSDMQNIEKIAGRKIEAGA